MIINLIEKGTQPAESRLDSPENWYAEPFTKRTGCKTPGQCGGDCDCGCPYNTMTETERLPLIEDIACIFPDEWLAFIISPGEDDEFEPIHGKLVAHSPHPDEVHDAVNTVLWNQHVYVFFNGDFQAMQASYGDTWDDEVSKPEQRAQRTYSGPKTPVMPAGEPVPDSLLDLVYSAIEKLCGTTNLNEAIRRLRLARVRAANAASPLVPLIDRSLDVLEGPLPRINEVIWELEEGLASLELDYEG